MISWSALDPRPPLASVPGRFGPVLIRRTGICNQASHHDVTDTEISRHFRPAAFGLDLAVGAAEAEAAFSAGMQSAFENTKLFGAAERSAVYTRVEALV